MSNLGTSKSILLFGSSGETGKEVLKALLSRSDVGKITLIGRRRLENYEEERKVTQKIVNFEALNERDLIEHDSAICTLGTTRAKDGSEGFIKVDFDYIVNTAKACFKAGIPEFHLLSSQGANQNSFFLYPQIKGKTEEAVKILNFPRLLIYRPGVLLCNRSEKRFGESLVRSFLGIVDYGSKISVSTTNLAAFIVGNLSSKDSENVKIFDNADIISSSNKKS